LLEQKIFLVLIKNNLKFPLQNSSAHIFLLKQEYNEIVFTLITFLFANKQEFVEIVLTICDSL
jgi:hypothetical protein